VRLDGRGVVVTGAGNGIGEALARRFHAAGARVVVADLDGVRADAVAGDLTSTRPASAWSIACDVSTAAGNHALVDAARAHLGEIDLFFANAGVGIGTDLESTDESSWQQAMDVNVHAHRWAAERLVPTWLARGEGYFCSTASAAGLLLQIGSGPYSVSKHAAVAFAEWLAVTYGDRGITVSCLCPQGVNTAMLSGGDDPESRAAGDVVRAAGNVLEPEQVAEVALRAIEAETFLILPHPEVHDYMQRKAADHNRWLAGMRKLQARIAGSG
jgi:NAD(P)-dependent dehydrogenase (short-subunit alcohol dehydrogenase family)